MKKVAVLLSLAAILLGATGALHADLNIYGVSGLIETPDGSILAPKSLGLTVNYISDIDDAGGSDALTFGGAFGLFENLEVGAVGIDVDAPGTDTEALINAKYRLLAETAERPSITVGVVDAASQLDDITADIDDPSFFLVVGKNITAAAEGISGSVSRPLRGTIGVGTGLYKGIFLGLDYSASENVNLMFEYLTEGIRQDSTFNAAIRYRTVGGFAINAGTIGFEGFYAGASYAVSTF